MREDNKKSFLNLSQHLFGVDFLPGYYTNKEKHLMNINSFFQAGVICCYLQFVLQNDVRNISIPLVTQGRAEISLLSIKRGGKICQSAVQMENVTVTMWNYLYHPRDY